MKKDKLHLLLFGFCFVILAFTSIKISAPALPILSSVFHTPATYLKLSGSIYLFAFAATQLIWGSVVRFCNRRHIILTSIGIACVGTIIAMLANNVEIFILGRVIEACGICVGSPICRVLMGDRLEKHEIAQFAVIFGVITSLIPTIAPTIGQYLMSWLNWRAIFAFFLICLLVYFFVVYFKLPETRQDFSTKLNIKNIIKDYCVVFSAGQFWFYIIPYAVTMSAITAYYIAIPFWYREHFHISVHYYTFLALFSAIPNFTTYFIVGRLIKYYGTKWCVVTNSCLLISLACLAFFFAIGWSSNVISLLILSALLGVCGGFIQPATNAALITMFRKETGAISAIIPFFPFILSPIMFFVWTDISLDSLWPITIVFLIMSLISLTTILKFSRCVAKEF